MTKRILLFAIIIAVLFGLEFFTNNYLLEKNEVTVRFSLLTVYLFNALFSLVIYTAIEIVFKFLPNETGYLYLGLMLVKFGVFLLMFQDAIFSEEGLSKPEKFSTVIPIFSFLIVETIFVSKLLNNR